MENVYMIANVKETNNNNNNNKLNLQKLQEQFFSYENVRQTDCQFFATQCFLLIP